MRKKIVIASPVRTAIGRVGRDGVFRDVPAEFLLRTCFREVIRRSHINPLMIDEVIGATVVTDFGAPNVGRISALSAGVPSKVPAYGVFQNCVSGLRAITSAAQAIKAGDGEVYLVGATESMSNWPPIIPKARWGMELGDALVIDPLISGLTDPIYREHMGVTAQRVAEKYGVDRGAQDAFAVSSHKKALKAQRERKFDEQIVPVTVRERGSMGQTREVPVTQDQGIRPDTKVEFLAALRPPPFFVQERDGGMVTAGNSSQLSDGAMAMLVLTAGKAQTFGITPTAEIVDYAYAGVDPQYMGEGPIPAIRKLLLKVGMRVRDIDFFEINEAFAAQCLPCQNVLEIPDEKLNIHGGAIALGHPIGATGGILTVKMAYILKEHNADYGIVAMCVGGGQGGAMLIKNYRGHKRRA